MTSVSQTDLRGTHFAVTGASGFIGRHLVESLAGLGARVTVLRRPGSPGVATQPSPRAHAVVILDWADGPACQATLQQLQPSHILHLAGHARSERSFAVLRQILDANLVSSMNLVLAAVEALPDTRVVLAGTLETADPWREPLALGSPYGISKAMLEVLSGGLQGLYGASVVNAKIGMVYGPGDPNSHRLVPTLIRSLLNGEAPRLSSGTRRCDWVHVADVVDALIRTAMLPRIDRPSVDIGTGQLHSVRQVAEILCERVGTSVSPVFSAQLDRPHEQERAADACILRQLAGWSACHELAQGLSDTLDWYRTQPP